MSQKQRAIDVFYLGGKVGVGSATGNNAGWHCLCSANAILVGFSDTITSTNARSVVMCPACGRSYRVIAPSWWGRAVEVREECGRDRRASVIV